MKFLKLSLMHFGAYLINLELHNAINIKLLVILTWCILNIKDQLDEDMD